MWKDAEVTMLFKPHYSIIHAFIYIFIPNIGKRVYGFFNVTVCSLIFSRKPTVQKYFSKYLSEVVFG